jgi:HK97 family phage prohead protease
MKRKEASIKIRDFALEVKAVKDDGTFEGYGSVFGVVDSYNEVVAPGAFTESLAEIAARGRPLPILWQHRSDLPIGPYTELKEDDVGLRVTGTLLKDELPLAAQAHALMRARVVSGLSIGYYVRESSYDEKTGIRTLKKVDLVEVSLVTFPANDDARVDAIKMKLAHGSLPTIREFEALLREQGFSKSQATRIAEQGFKQLTDDQGEPGHELASEISALSKYLANPIL